MFMNFMDYTSEDCMNMFSADQKNKMRSVFSIYGLRNSFMNSFVCDSTLSSAGPLPVDSNVSLNNASSAVTIKVFPNPVSTNFGFQVNGSYHLTGKSVTIINQAGIVLKSQRMISEIDRVDVSDFRPGIYLVSIGHGMDRRVLKLIKY
jgi:hypothetical protein